MHHVPTFGTLIFSIVLLKLNETFADREGRSVRICDLNLVLLARSV